MCERGGLSFQPGHGEGAGKYSGSRADLFVSLNDKTFMHHRWGGTQTRISTFAPFYFLVSPKLCTCAEIFSFTDYFIFNSFYCIYSLHPCFLSLFLLS